MSFLTIPKYWELATVEEVALKEKGSIVSGPFGSNIGKKFFVSSGVPLIRGNNLTKGGVQFIDTGFVFITEEKAFELRNCEAIKDDIIFTAAGTLGQVGIIPGNSLYPKYIISNKQLRIRVDKNIILSKYLFYWFSSLPMREYIINNNVGSSVPLITLSILKKLPILLPSLNIQKKIVKILSDFDDLIEVNLQRIKILGDVATIIYSEWFVNLKFPGYEKTEIIETKNGSIPKRWRFEKLSNVCAYISRGISPKYDDNSDCIVINQRCIRDNKINLELSRRNSKNVNQKKYVIFGDILVNSTGVGTLGRIAQIYENIENCTVDSHVTIIRGSQIINSDYLGLSLLHMEKYIASLGVGSTGQTELNKSVISDLDILLPLKEIQDIFSKTVKPFREFQLILQKKNQKLKNIRDTLLINLVSGLLNVNDVDIVFGG